jgi:branched-chain amino acid transport system permease protein
MEYALTILAMVAIWTILSASFNLVIGFAGLLIVAQPLFYGIGAYATAAAAMFLEVPVALAPLFGITAALMASLVLSIPCVRVSGDYLLIASIGFLLGGLQVIRNVEAIGGAGGLAHIPPLFTGEYRSLWFLLLTTGVAAGTLWLSRWLSSGDFGRAVVAMRDDEEALGGLGRGVLRIKVFLVAVSAGCAGLAGGLYALHFQFVSPDQFELLQAAMMLACVIVGGIGSSMGPPVGAAVVIALPQLITMLNLPPSIMAALQGMLFTGLVIAFLFFRPQGLFGSSVLVGGSRVEAK